MQRRSFLHAAGLALAGASLQAAAPARAPRILLRSSWQTFNIGDIAHTPGVLRLLTTYLPDAEVTLWPSRIDQGVDKMLMAQFPKLKIAQDQAARSQAFDECDFLLHGSGPSLVAQRHVEEWTQKTGKPYGVYGITLPQRRSTSSKDESQDALRKTVDVLSGAEFVFFRESKSLAFAKSLGCKSPVMQFAPDGAFACDLRQEEKAEAFLQQHDLQTGKFLCCIPRLRYTPTWTVPSKKRPFDPVRHGRNEEMKEHDHAPLRQAIAEVVRQTDLKILICPEDQSQMKIGKELLLDKLPEDVRPRVVWRPNYWLTGEAVSTYVRSAGLFGNEMHSPIMCIGHGVPAIVCRFSEQTVKGFMWQDIGLDDWLFDLDDEAQVAKVVPTVLDMAKNPKAAREKAAKARAVVEQRQRETMMVLSQTLGDSRE
ncbi:polysaccharide pyruvyl transferase family protein [Fuerstiella marisgermanici]|uniref:Polysaccharide pyruvyl transferase n=1 Tax=Fuerstiella marisgermanici TaxID=1891926 RepID=A0A1P8WG10_9PLAN|nr:polysaccharide pyruvyl transferase family protein [Fuerstiella marisgermanici]APZ92995.1 Polysaccharide pyruvyl transferase [Fuerstiella marisgermanici]